MNFCMNAKQVFENEEFSNSFSFYADSTIVYVDGMNNTKRYKYQLIYQALRIIAWSDMTGLSWSRLSLFPLVVPRSDISNHLSVDNNQMQE